MSSLGSAPTHFYTDTGMSVVSHLHKIQVHAIYLGATVNGLAAIYQNMLPELLGMIGTHKINSAYVIRTLKWKCFSRGPRLVILYITCVYQITLQSFAVKIFMSVHWQQCNPNTNYITQLIIVLDLPHRRSFFVSHNEMGLITQLPSIVKRPK